jgi:hypothetical protein
MGDGYTYRHTDRWEEYMKHSTEMGSGAMMFLPSFMKTGSAIQKFMRGIYRHTDSTVSFYFLKLMKVD